MHKRTMVSCLLIAAALSLCSHAMGEPYPVGYVWKRENQTPSTSILVPGKNYLRGNPWWDTRNSFVWSYEFVQSNGMDGLEEGPKAPLPWYRNLPELLVWDDSFQGGAGDWVVDDDTPATIGAERLGHFWASGDGEAWRNVPVVRWRNPAGNGMRISITGELVVEWVGEPEATPEFADVVLVRAGSNGGFAQLIAERIERPPSGGVTIPVDIPQITMEAGFSLLISVKGRVDAPSDQPVAGVTLRDDLTITLIRAPRQYCPPDINGDLTVDFADLNMLLGAFGQPCISVPMVIED